MIRVTGETRDLKLQILVALDCQGMPHSYLLRPAPGYYYYRDGDH